jgi:hypothetical protein
VIVEGMHKVQPGQFVEVIEETQAEAPSDGKPEPSAP